MGSWRAPVKRQVKPARSAESFGLAVLRAREHWDALTGVGQITMNDGTRRYSDVAAAGILALAVDLWASTAAALEGTGDGFEGGA